MNTTISTTYIVKTAHFDTIPSMGIKNFLMKKLVGAKLKHLPQDQQDMILALVSENPEFFKKISRFIGAQHTGLEAGIHKVEKLAGIRPPLGKLNRILPYRVEKII